jgi:hypothetical protein
VYGTLLCRRIIDYLLVYPSYNYTNEPRLLRQAARHHTAIGAATVTKLVDDGTNLLYRVDRQHCPPNP